MMSRLPAALARGLLVALVIVFPGIALPGVAVDSRLMAVFVAGCAGAFIVSEYLARAPSLLQFRSAPPLNRIRFASVSVSLIVVTFLLRARDLPTPLSRFADTLGSRLAWLSDIPFSPVRLMRQLVTPDLSEIAVQTVTKAAAVSYCCALLSVLAFLFVLMRGAWPFAGHRFNIWVNLPTFDPVGQGDTVDRLRHLGRFNLLLGVIAPFLIPAILAYSAGLADLSGFAAPNSLIWIVTIWAFMPASLVMRGIALLQIARLVETQRRAAAIAADGGDLSIA